MARRDGKSLVEYVMILGLVAVVAIPAVSYMGSTFNNSYLGSKPKSNAEKLFALLDVQKKSNANGSMASDNVLNGDGSFSGESVDFLILGGSATSAKGNLANLIKNGSSSTAWILANALEQIADSPELDEGMKTHLRALADIGFLNSEAAKAVEEAFLNGESMGTVSSLSGQLGFDGYSTIVGSGELAFGTEDAAGKTDWISGSGPNGKTKNLLDYYQTHVQGQIEDPTTAAVIHNLVDQIAHSAGSIQDLGTRVMGSGHPLGNTFSTTPRQEIYAQFMVMESDAFSTVAQSAHSTRIDGRSTRVCTYGDGTKRSSRCRKS